MDMVILGGAFIPSLAYAWTVAFIGKLDQYRRIVLDCFAVSLMFVIAFFIIKLAAPQNTFSYIFLAAPYLIFFSGVLTVSFHMLWKEFHGDFSGFFHKSNMPFENKGQEKSTPKPESLSSPEKIFAEVASHDLQEPLEKIIFFGDFLKERYGAEMDEKGRDYLERMIGSAMRVSRLIDDILQFSRLTSRTIEMTEVNLEEVVRDVISDLEVRIQDTHALVEVGKLPVIKADNAQMYHLFQNLITNAIKFRKEDEAPRIVVRALSAEDDFENVSIVVEDNGIGFEQEFAEQIFKPFERLHSQSKYDGSGLGLSICERIVSAHKGKINAKSVPGKGSIFMMTLPISERGLIYGEKSFDRG